MYHLNHEHNNHSSSIQPGSLPQHLEHLLHQGSAGWLDYGEGASDDQRNRTGSDKAAVTDNEQWGGHTDRWMAGGNAATGAAVGHVNDGNGSGENMYGNGHLVMPAQSSHSLRQSPTSANSYSDPAQHGLAKVDPQAPIQAPAQLCCYRPGFVPPHPRSATCSVPFAPGYSDILQQQKDHPTVSQPLSTQSSQSSIDLPASLGQLACSTDPQAYPGQTSTEQGAEPDPEYPAILSHRLPSSQTQSHQQGLALDCSTAQENYQNASALNYMGAPQDAITQPPAVYSTEQCAHPWLIPGRSAVPNLPIFATFPRYTSPNGSSRRPTLQQIQVESAEARHGYERMPHSAGLPGTWGGMRHGSGVFESGPDMTVPFTAPPYVSWPSSFSQPSTHPDSLLAHDHYMPPPPLPGQRPHCHSSECHMAAPNVLEQPVSFLSPMSLDEDKINRSYPMYASPAEQRDARPMVLPFAQPGAEIKDRHEAEVATVTPSQTQPSVSKPSSSGNSSGPPRLPLMKRPTPKVRNETKPLSKQLKRRRDAGRKELPKGKKGSGDARATLKAKEAAKVDRKVSTLAWDNAESVIRMTRIDSSLKRKADQGGMEAQVQDGKGEGMDELSDLISSARLKSGVAQRQKYRSAKRSSELLEKVASRRLKLQKPEQLEASADTAHATPTSGHQTALPSCNNSDPMPDPSAIAINTHNRPTEPVRKISTSSTRSSGPAFGGKCFEHDFDMTVPAECPESGDKGMNCGRGSPCSIPTGDTKSIVSGEPQPEPQPRPSSGVGKSTTSSLRRILPKNISLATSRPSLPVPAQAIKPVKQLERQAAYKRSKAEREADHRKKRRIQEDEIARLLNLLRIGVDTTQHRNAWCSLAFDQVIMILKQMLAGGSVSSPDAFRLNVFESFAIDKDVIPMAQQMANSAATANNGYDAIGIGQCDIRSDSEESYSTSSEASPVTPPFSAPAM